MSDTVLRQRLIRVASQLPQGSAERRQVLALLREAAPSSPSFFGKTTKLPFIDVQGYAGFTDQIRQLQDLSTQANALAAQIDAAVSPLLKEKAKLDKDIKAVHETIKGEYKENLTKIGNITIERKTALVDARAMIQVVEKKRDLDEVQAELLQAVIAKYGKEVADFIETTSAALQDTNKNMAIAFKGFELEHKAKTASVREAGMLDNLVRFRDYLMSGWKRLVSVVQNALGLVENASAKVEKTHNELVKAINAVH